jgi:thiol-disulfide isomerase/thioredoxin
VVTAPLCRPRAGDAAAQRGRVRVVGLLALALTAGGRARAAQDRTAEVRIGATLGDAVLKGLNGPSRRLSDYRGRPLIINIWASWCGPCVGEMASLERLAWQDDRLPFSMIGISTDDDEQAAQTLLERSHATIRHFIDENLKMEHMLGASSVPLTVLVDARGRVIDKVHGSRQWDSPESLDLISRSFGWRRSRRTR